MVIDQRLLPFRFETVALTSVEEVYNAISNMTLRGAPLIGAAAAFGIYLACLEAGPGTRLGSHINNAARYLISSRPTAVNLEWAVKRQLEALQGVDDREKAVEISFRVANEISDGEAENCRKIGEAGLPLLKAISEKKEGGRVNILTHCNAGWLACVDYGTATAPIYLAHDSGIEVHVWVDETRPRNQGARLTAYELGAHGVPHTVITDNAGGHLMQKGLVDMVIVGSDRTTASGDVANKIGTYLKALAAYDNNIPFYAALPSSTIDLAIDDGVKEIEVEERNQEEVRIVEGEIDGEIKGVRICPEKSEAYNPGFDITPARLVTGLITEKGVIEARRESIISLFNQ